MLKSYGDCAYQGMYKQYKKTLYKVCGANCVLHPVLKFDFFQVVVAYLRQSRNSLTGFNGE